MGSAEVDDEIVDVDMQQAAGSWQHGMEPHGMGQQRASSGNDKLNKARRKKLRLWNKTAQAAQKNRVRALSRRHYSTRIYPAIWWPKMNSKAYLVLFSYLCIYINPKFILILTYFPKLR